MPRTLSAEEITREVGEAMEETLGLEAYPERLWPYTAAELNFLKDFTVRAITRVMDRAQDPAGD